MSRRNQIYVVRSLSLEIEHAGRQIFTAHLAADPKLADRIVLAKIHLRVQPEKNKVPDPRVPEMGFFPVMKIYRGHPRKIPNPAISELCAFSVNTAGAGAKIASASLCIEGFRPARRFAGLEKLQISTSYPGRRRRTQPPERSTHFSPSQIPIIVPEFETS